MTLLAGVSFVAIGSLGSNANNTFSYVDDRVEPSIARIRESKQVAGAVGMLAPPAGANLCSPSVAIIQLTKPKPIGAPTAVSNRVRPTKW
jgi:hypothetical protein